MRTGVGRTQDILLSILGRQVEDQIAAITQRWNTWRQPPSEEGVTQQARARNLVSPLPPLVDQVTALFSKRTYALLELLSSERAYASELALIRTDCIPLALDQHISRVSEQVDSLASSSPPMSRDANPSWSSPMTPHDVRRIFGNIVELAELSDTLCDRLEPALGNMLEDGGADSCVGQVFLDLIPSLEPLYKTYISGHQLSLSHYAALTTPTPSPALRTYLGTVESKASSFTDTRDLRSLLEKPVHRFLRYPALLQAIYEETPDGHRDKENLKKAREELLRALRSVNEGLRRREVVRVVLNTVGSKSHSRKKRTFSGLTTGLKLGFIQSLNQSLPYEREPDPGAVNVGSHSHWYDGAEDVSQYERELQLFAKFIEDFHRVVKTWVASVKDFHMQQLVWSLAFGRMMNFVDSDDNSTELSESFDAFVVVSKSYILPACQTMQASIEVRVLARLDMLSDSMEGPMKLLGAMRTLRPLHHHLLRHPSAASGGRDASALMEASQSYVLLRSQLAAELPGYLALLEKGVRGCVGVFVEHQVTLWEGVRSAWIKLWGALREDDEDLSQHMQ